MKNRLLSLALAVCFVAGSAGVGMAAKTKSVECTVKSVDGNTVVVECGKKVRNLQPGTKVKVTEMIEGCG